MANIYFINGLPHLSSLLLLEAVSLLLLEAVSLLLLEAGSLLEAGGLVNDGLSGLLVQGGGGWAHGHGGWGSADTPL